MSAETRAVIQRLHEAFITHDIEALAGCVAEDCTFDAESRRASPMSRADHSGCPGPC
jgi:hypothetical protein